MTAPPSSLYCVLLIDDQPLAGDTLRQMLADEPDNELHCCHEPIQAILLANQIKPSAILHT